MPAKKAPVAGAPTPKPAAKKRASRAKAPKPAADLVDHIVTQEDLDANADLVTQGVSVGDTIQVPATVYTEGGNIVPHPSAETDATPIDEDAAEDAGQVIVAFIEPNQGRTERVFDRNTHGEHFVDTAKEFIATHADKGAQPIQ